MFGIGTPELLIMLVVLLLLFGTRLPSVMRGMGQGVNEFKKGLKEGEQEAKSEANIAHEEE